MIIYHAITTYHLIQAWVHKLLFHSDDEVIFIYDDVMNEKFNNIEFLEKNGVFSKVYPIPYRQSPKNREELMEWMNGVFNKLDIKDSDTIYVAGAQFYFSYWLILNNISFIFCEEASGRLSKPEVVMRNDQTLNELRYEIASENGMYTGNNVNVIQKIYNKKAQIQGFFDDKAIDFDVVEAIAKLDVAQKKQILEYFNAPSNIQVKRQSVVILTQHFTNLKMLSLEQQVELYQQTIDYYLDDYFPIIKVHPDDQIYYRQIIKNALVIDTKFPSELLPYIFQEMPEKIATISSTGIYSFINIFHDYLNFDPSYENNYYKNHQFFLIGNILKKIFENRKVILDYHGENRNQFVNMLWESKLELHNIQLGQAAEVVLWDEYISEELDKNKINIILEPEKQIFIMKSINNIKEKIVIKKILIYKEKQFIKEERVLFYIPEDKSKEYVLNMSYTKKLENSNLEIVVMDENELENRVAILEAILEATENRLRNALMELESRGEETYE